jgi:hypothetical protein
LTEEVSALRRPVLSSVSSAALAHAGIRLQPPTSSAVVSHEAAERAAVRAMPGRTVRETVLADFSDTHTVPAISTLAWAVSLTVPPGSRPPWAGPFPGSPGMEPSYLVVFIDARTGAFIMATSRGRLQPRPDRSSEE